MSMGEELFDRQLGMLLRGIRFSVTGEDGSVSDFSVVEQRAVPGTFFMVMASVTSQDRRYMHLVELRAGAPVAGEKHAVPCVVNVQATTAAQSVAHDASLLLTRVILNGNGFNVVRARTVSGECLDPLCAALSADAWRDEAAVVVAGAAPGP